MFRCHVLHLPMPQCLFVVQKSRGTFSTHYCCWFTPHLLCTITQRFILPLTVFLGLSHLQVAALGYFLLLCNDLHFYNLNLGFIISLRTSNASRFFIKIIFLSSPVYATSSKLVPSTNENVLLVIFF